ncbi:MAG TPA: hypothetical protein PLM09_07145 [Casimicrobiaceae bacterium]|nr:hypothetical protein [Casimicrobiaceae bacterium]
MSVRIASAEFAAATIVSSFRAAEPGGEQTADFARFVTSETAKWGKVVRDSGVTLD